MNTDVFDPPECSECREEVTASRTAFTTDTDSPVMTETYEPCGCVTTFPLPTRDNNLATAELAGHDQRRASSAPWHAGIALVSFGSLVYTATAAVANGHEPNVAIISMNLLLMAEHSWWWHLARTRNAIVRRLTAKDAP